MGLSFLSYEYGAPPDGPDWLAALVTIVIIAPEVILIFVWKKTSRAAFCNSSPFPLPWLTFQFHTGLLPRLQKSQEESKSIKRQLYEGMFDHHSYTHNLSSCEIKA